MSVAAEPALYVQIVPVMKIAAVATNRKLGPTRLRADLWGLGSIALGTFRADRWHRFSHKLCEKSSVLFHTPKAADRKGAWA